MSKYLQMWEKIRETNDDFRLGYLAGYGPAQGKDVEFQGEKFFDVDLLESIRNSLEG